MVGERNSFVLFYVSKDGHFRVLEGLLWSEEWVLCVRWF